MDARPHEIDGKVVDPKRAVPRDQSSRAESNISTKRLYVSGVRDEHTEEEFRQHFSQYGGIEKVCFYSKSCFVSDVYILLVFTRLCMCVINTHSYLIVCLLPRYMW